MNDAAPSPIPPAPAAEAVSGSALAADLLRLPAAPAAPSPAPAVPSADAPRDSLGRAFDASRFRTNPDGTPFRRKGSGEFMPRGGRKPGSVNAPKMQATPASAEPPRASFVPPLPSSPSPAETPAGNAKEPAKEAAPAVSRNAYEQTAEGYLRTAYLGMEGLLDAHGEWLPDDKDEHAALKEPLVEWLVISGAPTLPAWARFAVAVVNYVFKRLPRKHTAEAVAKLWKSRNARPVAPAAPPADPAPGSAPAHTTLELPTL